MVTREIARGAWMNPAETGFFYLNSRYYDPETGRFINADDVSMLGADGTPLSYNLYAYCFNNPVNMTDSLGNWPDWVETAAKIAVGVATIAAGVALLTTVVTTAPLTVVVTAAAIGTVGGAATNAVTQYARNSQSWDNFDVDECITAGVTGGLSGALATTGIGKIGQGIGNAILSGVNSAINGDSLLDVAINAGTGFLAGVAGGDGTGRGGFWMNETQRNKSLTTTFLSGFVKSTIVASTKSIVTGVAKLIKKAITLLE